jgi:hypothetical protein
MTSKAFADWQSVRTQRINQLMGIHALVGSNAGMPRAAEQVEHALILRLAGEFQGFCKDLHDEASWAIAKTLAAGDAGLRDAIVDTWTDRRRLDSGNAHPDALRQDFGRFQVDLWRVLGTKFPGQAGDWERMLSALNEARNGLAHDEPGKLVRLRAKGLPLAIPTVRRWRRCLDGLTVGIDRVIGEKLTVLLHRAPW